MTALALALWAGCAVAGPSPDWPAVEREAEGYLADLVRIDTSNPPGNVVPAVEYLGNVLMKAGIAARRYEIDAVSGRVALLARLPGRGKGKPLLMLSHLDVVPVDPARWKFPAFDPVVRDGELWGRGTLDMKGQAVTELMALLLLKRAGFRPARDVLILFNPDEETGGVLGAKWMVDHAWKDLDPGFVLDEGSSGTTGVLTSDGRTVFGIAVDEKRVLWMKLVATGDSGHGSMPSGRNAVEKLARILPKIPALAPPPRESAVVAEMRRRLGTLPENDITRALARTTVTLTTLKAGVGDPPKVNVIPGRAEATIDCRLIPGDSASAMIASVRALLADPDVTLEVVHQPADVPPAGWDTPLYRAIERTVARHVTGAVSLPVMLTGGTDARYFRARGVPGYGFEPMVRTAAEEELIHGDDERIRLTEFRRGLRMYHDLLRDFLR